MPNGVLYEYSDLDNHKEAQLVAPIQACKTVMNEYHDTTSFGHNVLN